MSQPLKIVFIGLSISSSWGNGHATTYRALVRGLHAAGHDVTFLERDVPWYASHRDAPEPEGCRLELYASVDELRSRFRTVVESADAVIVGSYVPDGVEVLRWVLDHARGLRLFYDIDTPITLSHFRRGEATYIAPQSVPELTAYLSFTGGPVLRQLEEEFGAKLALPLYCSVDAERYLPTNAPKQRDLGYLGTYSPDRQPALDRLLTEPARAWPSGRFVVAGPSYVGQVWPSNVERIEHVAPGDHPAFYGSLRFTLNITRADMLKAGYAPSVRLFEAAACGVPIISDVWPGIEQFFEPGSEILLAKSGEDTLTYLRDMSEADRVRVGERARARVLRQHTSVHRSQKLAHYIIELAAGRGSSLRLSGREPTLRRSEGPFPPNSVPMIGS